MKRIARTARGSTVEAALCIALAVLMCGSLCVGIYPISPSSAVGVMWSLLSPWPHAVQGWSETERVVVTLIRLPRVLLGGMAGAGLGMAGAAMQGLFRNPLVGPDLIGITSGASAGAALAILLSLPEAGISLLAWAGAIVALLAVILSARIAKRGGLLSLVLSGVVVSSLLSACVGLAEYLADPYSKLPDLIYWLLGSFAGASAGKVTVVGATLLLGGIPLLLLRWRLNVLSLGEDDARTLVVHARTMRGIVIGSAAMIVAGQVSVSGNVGWVGLIVPHFARMVVGADHRRLLPVAGLMGAFFTLGCDDIARSITHQEIPIGLITSLVGTPVFLFIFWRTQARGWTRE